MHLGDPHWSEFKSEALAALHRATAEKKKLLSELPPGDIKRRNQIKNKEAVVEVSPNAERCLVVRMEAVRSRRHFFCQSLMILTFA